MQYNPRKLNRYKGKKTEEIAAKYLREKGWKILEQNYVCKFGEIDLIALDGDAIVFVEVKYRSRDYYGDPGEAVTLYKQRRISRAACWYLIEHQWDDRVCRFDVICIYGNKTMRHIEQAYDSYPI